MSAPFSVLHVCTGNICRSPMSERILDGLTGDDVFNHGAGISSFHDGDPMQANSARELDERGFESDGHRARHIEREHVESSDLILVATVGHLDYIADRFPESVDKTFLVRQFGAIAAATAAELPDGDAVTRGKALVATAAKRRGDYSETDLSDPWGLGRAVYSQIADQLEDALEPVADALDAS
ncbi:phosphotyrosine protein phosphatase [Glycomyces sp. L485]|uniref:arsenate reductase/protein-tyrosine-phosphatase family protein n=1 Tax=Glycomyces sp. L485 TaxID=2909235 RepID=UPI001F4BA8C0|nr:phosphotyrosine protein phosphatase [Glycomyces sp. L485]MCH7231425.1 phosphotyrosine protein phosphatase [Glycomyces sp. L485]